MQKYKQKMRMEERASGIDTEMIVVGGNLGEGKSS